MASRSVIFVGPFPPPIHGASNVTSSLYQLIKTHANPLELDVHRISTAGDTLVRTPAYHLRRIQAHARAIAKILSLRIRGPLTLYIGGAGGAGIWYQAALVVLARISSSRVIFHHHNFSYITSKRRRVHIGMMMLSRILRKQDHHVFLTPGMRDLFLARYRTKARKIVVSNAAFVHVSGSTSAWQSGDRVQLIHISNLSRSKGSHVVLEAFRLLRTNSYDIALTLVGPCADGKLLAEIKATQCEFPEEFQYVGPVDAEGVARLLRESHVFVFPTTYENEAQPLVILEALAHGIPAVATKQGAIPEMLPGEWLMSDASVEEAAARIADLLRTNVNLLPQRALAEFERSKSDGLDELITLIICGATRAKITS